MKTSAFKMTLRNKHPALTVLLHQTMIVSCWTKAKTLARAIHLCWGTHFSFFNGSIVNEAENPKVNKDPVKKTSRFILGQGSANCGS